MTIWSQKIKRVYGIWHEVFNGTFSFRLSKLLAVLQMDFEVEDVSSQSEIQVIKWELTLPDEVKMMGASEGTMRIYTTQRDFVGLAPLVMVGNSLKIVKKVFTICLIKKKKEWKKEVHFSSTFLLLHFFFICHQIELGYLPLLPLDCLVGDTYYPAIELIQLLS